MQDQPNNYLERLVSQYQVQVNYNLTLLPEFNTTVALPQNTNASYSSFQALFGPQSQSMGPYKVGQKLDLNKLSGDSRFESGFIDKVRSISQSLGINAEDLMVAMAFETGGSYSPRKVNSLSGATGLIQFLSSTAKSLGTSLEALSSMTQIQQLDYVYKYLKQWNIQGGDFGTVYMSIFSPAWRKSPDSTIVYRQGTKAYAQNKGLDTNKDGNIQKGELVRKAWEGGIIFLPRAVIK